MKLAKVLALMVALVPVALGCECIEDFSNPNSDCLAFEALPGPIGRCSLLPGACRDVTIIGCRQVLCDGDETCQGADITTTTLIDDSLLEPRIDCSAFGSCKGATLTAETGEVDCDGGEACQSATVEAASAKCSGLDSCSVGAKLNVTGDVRCSEDRSCDSAEIHAGSSVYCTHTQPFDGPLNEGSCKSAVIHAGSNVNCENEGSCNFAEIHAGSSVGCVNGGNCNSAEIHFGYSVTCDFFGNSDSDITTCEGATITSRDRDGNGDIDTEIFCREGCKGATLIADTILCTSNGSCKEATMKARRVECLSAKFPLNVGGRCDFANVEALDVFCDTENCQRAHFNVTNTITCHDDGCPLSTIEASHLDCSALRSCRDITSATETIDCGSNSCRGAKMDTKSVACSGDDACQAAEIVATDSIGCTGPRSCSSFITVRSSLTAVNGIECSGINSCREASVSASQIKCSGTEACQLRANLVATNDIDCSGEHSCRIEFTAAANKVTCNGVSTCQDRVSLTANSGVHCTGSRSCEGAQMTATDEIECGSSNSCRSAVIEASTVYCSGDNDCTPRGFPSTNVDACGSCRSATVEASEAYCSGEVSCYNATITATDSDCSGYQSCGTSTMTSTNNKCSAFQSCHSSTLTGTNSYCSGQASCQGDNTVLTTANNYCSGEVSCSGISFAGTETVVCEGLGSCRFASSIETISIVCQGASSCRIIQALDAIEVYCNGSNSCSGSTITSNCLQCNIATLTGDNAACTNFGPCTWTKTDGSDPVPCRDDSVVVCLDPSEPPTAPPSLPQTGPPTSTPTGPATEPPTAPPSLPQTGPPTSTPTGPATERPTAPPTSPPTGALDVPCMLASVSSEYTVLLSGEGAGSLTDDELTGAFVAGFENLSEDTCPTMLTSVAVADENLRRRLQVSTVITFLVQTEQVFVASFIQSESEEVLFLEGFNSHLDQLGKPAVVSASAVDHVASSPVLPPVDVKDATMNGDPHLRSWSGSWWDYHGECDLLYYHVASFLSKGVSLTITVRTKLRRAYSYIEGAAVRIGNDTLEVVSFGEHAYNEFDHAELDNLTLAGYPIMYSSPNARQHSYAIIIDEKIGSVISITTFKDLVGVQIKNGTKAQFGRGYGILGSWDGQFLARDGVTVLEDKNAFGQEWQVHDDEPMLFRYSRAPQYPEEKCKLPNLDASVTHRRLGEAKVSAEEAMTACAHLVGRDQQKNCEMDVMLIGDVDIATSGIY